MKNSIPRRFLVTHLQKTDGKSILITFDDGPEPEITPAVLDRLKEYDVRAIFFIPGRRLKRAPDLLNKIIEEGHLLGNHSYYHCNFRQPNFYNYYLDVKKCQMSIEQFTGVQPKLFRPPGGRVSVRSILVPQILGLKTITWSVDVQDWKCRTELEAEQAADKIIKFTKSEDIILLHDDNPHIIKILDFILPAFREQEFNLYSGLNFI